MNQFRSAAFIKIKHNIEKSFLPTHLKACRYMIENATPIFTKDELIILKEYMLSAWDRINPIGESFADEIDSMYMKQINAD